MCLLFLVYILTHNVPADDSLGRNVVSVPQTLICTPDGFAYGKRTKLENCDFDKTTEGSVCNPKMTSPLWQKDMDWIFAALKEGGFDQHFYYK